MDRLFFTPGLFPLLFFSCIENNDQSSVRSYEEEITIPGYLVVESDKNPFFCIPRNYQGAQLHICPYPYLNRLTETRVDKNYKGLRLENPTIQKYVYKLI